jgi:hypothetical protein
VYLQPWVSRLVQDNYYDDLEWLNRVYGISFDQPIVDTHHVEPICLPDSLTLTDLLRPPPDPDLVELLRRRQLEAVVREGLQ